MGRNITTGWLVAGDLNDVMSQDEKKGGVPVSSRRCNIFLDNINACNLIDLGAVGLKFTWKGPLFNGHERIFERLDRALGNDEWRLLFPEAVVKVLPRIDFSDHHPIMVLLNGVQPMAKRNKFRFEKAWMYHEKYNELIENKWHVKPHIKDKTKFMEDELCK
jgi:hypothetical protein